MLNNYYKLFYIENSFIEPMYILDNFIPKPISFLITGYTFLMEKKKSIRILIIRIPERRENTIGYYAVIPL